MSRSVGRFAAALAQTVTKSLSPWRAAMAQAYASQLLTPTWTVTSRHGAMTFAGPSGRCLQYARAFATDEPETVAWIDAMPADAVLWDIGANVGVYAIYAAKRGLRVVAFEPCAGTLAVLTTNIERNGVGDRVAAYGVALADKTGLDSLYMAADRTEPGHAVHSFGTRETVDGVIEGGFQQAAIGFTADAFFAQFAPPAPTHVKLDVDGIEAAVLRGASGVIAGSVRELMVEIYDEMNPDQAAAIRSELALQGLVEIPTAFPEGRNKLFRRG